VLAVPASALFHINIPTPSAGELRKTITPEDVEQDMELWPGAEEDRALFEQVRRERMEKAGNELSGNEQKLCVATGKSYVALQLAIKKIDEGMVHHDLQKAFDRDGKVGWVKRANVERWEASTQAERIKLTVQMQADHDQSVQQKEDEKNAAMLDVIAAKRAARRLIESKQNGSADSAADFAAILKGYTEKIEAWKENNKAALKKAEARLAEQKRIVEKEQAAMRKIEHEFDAERRMIEERRRLVTEQQQAMELKAKEAMLKRRLEEQKRRTEKAIADKEEGEKALNKVQETHQVLTHELKSVDASATRVTQGLEALAEDELDCPKLFVLQRDDAESGYLNDVWHLVFLCAFDLKPAKCGLKGNGYRLKLPSNMLRTIAPALKMSLYLMKGLFKVANLNLGDLGLKLDSNLFNKGGALGFVEGLKSDLSNLALTPQDIAKEVTDNIPEEALDKLEDAVEDIEEALQDPAKQASFREAGGHAYRSLLAVLQQEFPDWKSTLNMKKEADVDGRVAFVTPHNANYWKFSSKKTRDRMRKEHAQFPIGGGEEKRGGGEEKRGGEKPQEKPPFGPFFEEVKTPNAPAGYSNNGPGAKHVMEDGNTPGMPQTQSKTASGGCGVFGACFGKSGSNKVVPM